VNLIASFESFIERLMERTFTRATNSHLQPVEIGKRLVRVMESQQSVGVDGVLVPNLYDVYLNPQDFAFFEGARGSHEKYLESHVARVARQRRFSTVTRPVVRLHSRRELAEGDLRIEAHVEDAKQTNDNDFQHTALLPRMDGPVHTRPSTPNLVCAGKTYAVLRSPSRVGRLPDNDIVLNDRRVSRYHAEVSERSGRWMLRDTGSTNGTAVNGKVTKETVLRPGDTISLGGLEVLWDQ